MRIPSRPHRLTRVLSVQPADVDVRAWQAHVLKHPLGLGALYNLTPLRGDRRWNAEGWDATEPPAITRAERAELVAGVLALEIESHRCAATRLDHEEYRGEAPYERMPCYGCPRPLAARCEAVTRVVGERYAAVVVRMLEALDDAVEVRRGEAYGRITTDARRGEIGGTVLSIGRFADGNPGGRINDVSGVRVELYLEGGTLRWRTTYRRPVSSPSDHASFLVDVLPPMAGRPLSDRVLVPRRWWERTS